MWAKIFKRKTKGEKETEVKMKVKDQLFKLFSEGHLPHSDEVKAVVPNTGSRNLYYAMWKRNNYSYKDPKLRLKALGFMSSQQRHSWIIEHMSEILDYATKHSHKATLEKFNIGNETLRELRKGKWANQQPTPETPDFAPTGKPPGTPENLRDYIKGVVISTDDFFAIKDALAEKETLKAENESLKEMLDKWQKLAGNLNTDIATLMRQGK